MNEQENPYAAPQEIDDHSAAGHDYRTEERENYAQLRRQHLKTEVSVKGWGLLILLGSTMKFVASTFYLISSSGFVGYVAYATMNGVSSLIIAVVYFFAGLNLRRLKPQGSKLYMVGFSLGIMMSILAFAVGQVAPEHYATRIGAEIANCIIPVLILLYLNSKKVHFVCTTTYREKIIPATPDIKYKSPWLVLFILLALCVLVIIFAVYKS